MSSPARRPVTDVATPATVVAVAVIAIVGIAYWQLRIVGSVERPGKIRAANGDLYAAYLPVHHFAYRSDALVPLWNPHQLAGTPFRANANGVLYPPNLIGTMLPVERTFGLLGAFHLVLAGCGALACAFALGLTALASVLAAVAFMLSSHLVQALVHPSHLAGYAWLGWVALATGGLLERPGPKRAMLLGIVGAMLVLTGSSQMVVYSAYAAVAGGAGYLLGRRPLPAGYLRRVAVAVALGVATTAGLAAIQIVPTVEMLADASRQGVPLDRMQAPTATLAVLRQFVFTSGGACVLAVAAIFDRERKRFLWAAVAVLALAALVGSGSWLFSTLFYHLPMVDRFRAPQRMLVIGQLAIALLAAMGLDALRARGPRRVRVVVVATAALLVVAASPLWTGVPRSLLAAQIAVVAVAGVAIVIAASVRRRTRAAAAVAIVAVLLCGRFAARGNALTMPEHHAPGFFAPPRFVQFLRERAGEDRVLIVRNRRTLFPLMAKAGTLWGLNVVEDYEPLAPRRYGEVRAAFGVAAATSAAYWLGLAPGDRERQWRFFDLLSTRYVVVQAGEPWPAATWDRFASIYRDRHVEIFESRASLPRAYLVDRFEVLATNEASAIPETIHTFDPRESVVLDSAPEWRAANGLEAVARGATITRVAPEEVLLRVATPTPAVLVLTDLHWPGWQATVDGEPRPIVRANLLLRAVALEAGEHEVRFRYSPSGAAAGTAVSLITIASVAGGLVLRRWRAVRRTLRA